MNAKTFWTVCSALALLSIGSFGHSQYLDGKQTDEKTVWRQDFKGDIRRSIDAVKDSVKDLKDEQRDQAKSIREDTKNIQESLNRLLTDQRRDRTR
ncbi:MAG: hypothetical protein HY348_01770 [Nitrospira defluvii]|nr:hypothetical protein [Nitrospira defluvii]